MRKPTETEMKTSYAFLEEAKRPAIIQYIQGDLSLEDLLTKLDEADRRVEELAKAQRGKPMPGTGLPAKQMFPGPVLETDEQYAARTGYDYNTGEKVR